MLKNPYGCDRILRSRFYFYLDCSVSLEVSTDQCNAPGFILADPPTVKNQFSLPDIQRRFQILRDEGCVIMAWVGWKYFIKLKLLAVSVLNICSVLFLRDLPLNCYSSALSLPDPASLG